MLDDFLKSSLFRDVMQRTLVVNDVSKISIGPVSKSQAVWTVWSLRMVPIHSEIKYYENPSVVA